MKKAHDILHGQRILRITDNAVCLGVEGAAPDLRANDHGVLALTDRSLLFLPWHMRQPVILPFCAVRSMAARDSFRSATVPGHVLIVELQSAPDKKASLAWLVDDPREWAGEMERRRPGPGVESWTQTWT